MDDEGKIERRKTNGFRYRIYYIGYIIDTDIPFPLSSTRYVFDEECLEVIDE